MKKRNSSKNMLLLSCALVLSGCGGGSSDTGSTPAPVQVNSPPVLVSDNEDQTATVGLAFNYDASKSDSAFTDSDNDQLTYTVTFSGSSAGLSANGAVISGTPSNEGTFTVSIIADDGNGGSASDSFSIICTEAAVVNNAPVLVNANPDQTVTVGTSFSHDVSQSGSSFSDPDGDTLTYTVNLSPEISGLTVNDTLISGTPAEPGITTVSISVDDGNGGSASDSFTLTVVAATAGLTEPVLPAVAFNYTNLELPDHFINPDDPLGNVVGTDNTPSNNPLTDAGATLGRVLFYDKRLSANDTVSCASCHSQAHGFSDPEVLSTGFEGGLTARHSMGLANAVYYRRGRAFWDERASSFEEQALMPIEDSVEMGSELNQLVAELSATPFYPALFEDAFGTTEVNSERIGLALAQFVRSLVSFQSKYDQGVSINFTNFTAEEALGHRLFSSDAPSQGRSVGCNRCHSTSAQIANNVFNNGLDADTGADQGAGNGEFKVPSLRNIAVRAPFMHDGRFASLEEVVDFYDSGVQAHPNLDNRLRDQNDNPRRLNLSDNEKAALVAFMGTLTDEVFLNDEKFSDPFPE